MENPFAKVGFILKFEASCEKNEKSFYGEEFKVIPFFKKQIKLSVFKNTLLQTPLKKQKNQSKVFIQDIFLDL